MPKICPESGSSCLGHCHKSNETLCIDFADEKHWHKVTTVKEVFDIFGKSGEAPYMLVAGNTAHGNNGTKIILFSVNKRISIGVYHRNENLKIFIDITGVEELRSHDIGPELVLGGGVTLTEAMDILTNASTQPGFEYCKHLVDHIDLIANVPVRNVSGIVNCKKFQFKWKPFCL